MTGRSRAGFTLVELLVVVAIIAILGAMMAPIYLNAKKAAQRANCQSNLAQIAKAFESYTNDYNGCYPNLDNQYLWAGFYWRDPMRRYVVAPNSATQKMILACPADPTPPGIYAGTSYAYSACFYMTPDQTNAIGDSNYIRSKYATTNPKLPCSTMMTSDVKYPTRKAHIAEYWTLHSEKPKVGWYDDPAETGNDPWSGSRNYLFADGHVTNLPARKIHAATSPVVSRSRLLPDINLTTNGIAGKDLY